jgi:outer membrane protein assembly factor BamB
MINQITKVATIICSLVLLSLPVSTMAADVLGKKPHHVWGGPSSVVNDQTITKMIWAPGVDDGYVPQGITVAEGSVLLSGYQSTNPKIDRGPCRVFKVDVKTGEYTGQFDLPEDCGHAGGIAYIGQGVLVASDTRRLYKIDMKTAFQDGNTKNALLGNVRLGGELKGSLVDFDGTSIFIGSSEKDASKAKSFFLPVSIFEAHNGKTIEEDIASKSFPIAAEAQGAAFDKQGNLWMTFSSSKYGQLQKVDPNSGKVLAQYEMVIGIEDIGFDEDGRLWSVSEAGSLRWSKWSKTFPVIFQMDVSKLK